MASHLQLPIPCINDPSSNCATNGRVWLRSTVQVYLRLNALRALHWKYSESMALHQHGHASHLPDWCNLFARGISNAFSPYMG